VLATGAAVNDILEIVAYKTFNVTNTLAPNGSAANLTNLPAAQLTGALPAISGAALTSLASANLTGALPAVSGAALTSLTSANLTGALPAVSGAALTGIQGIPTGMLSYFAASTAPTGFLAADGSAVSRSTYAALFAITGVIYGAGNGSSTFQLPDLRGEFMRGWDNSRGVDNGRAFGSAQASQFGAHKHIGGNLTHVSHTRLYGGGASSGNSPGTAYTSDRYYGFTQTVGGTENSNETRSRNVALLACIKI